VGWLIRIGAAYFLSFDTVYVPGGCLDTRINIGRTVACFRQADQSLHSRTQATNTMRNRRAVADNRRQTDFDLFSLADLLDMT
jgi:hypothetical protein